MATTTGATHVGYRRRILGGAVGNARLTALSGAMLLVLLAIEGATIPFLGSLLSVHIFVGMLLLGPVALKLASTGYRFARYYSQAREYVEAGPPAPLMRVLVGPVLVLSTLTLFTTGVLLIASPQRGTVLGLHKASFVVWVIACARIRSVHSARAARGTDRGWLAARRARAWRARCWRCSCGRNVSTGRALAARARLGPLTARGFSAG